MKVAVIGAGSWGTALAQVLAGNGHEAVLWARKDEVVRGINEDHRNPRYLSDAVLHDSVSATLSQVEALKGAQAAVIVTPSKHLRETAMSLKEAMRRAFGAAAEVAAAGDMAAATDAADTASVSDIATVAAAAEVAKLPIIVCSKGVEEGSGLLPIDVLADVLGNRERFAVLSGPNHAEEVIRHVPAATVVASPSHDTALFFQDLFAAETFRTYTSEDVCGVELCAAFKNVIAIAVGLSYGMGYGDNTAALLLTRGLAEMSRLVVACGGQALTCMGLAGAGDMVATCMSQHSRNRRFGEMLAHGKTLADFTAETHMVAEGAIACKSIAGLAEKHGVELPIAQVVHDVVWDGLDASRGAQSLAARPLTTEFYGIC